MKLLEERSRNTYKKEFLSSASPSSILNKLDMLPSIRLNNILGTIPLSLSFSISYLQQWMPTFILSIACPTNITGTLMCVRHFCFHWGRDTCLQKYCHYKKENKGLFWNDMGEILIHRLQRAWSMFVANEKLKKKQNCCILMYYQISGWLVWSMIYHLWEESI